MKKSKIKETFDCWMCQRDTGEKWADFKKELQLDEFVDEVLDLALDDRRYGLDQILSYLTYHIGFDVWAEDDKREANVEILKILSSAHLEIRKFIDLGAYGNKKNKETSN